jgi:hypothetical protein
LKKKENGYSEGRSMGGVILFEWGMNGGAWRVVE